MGLSLNFPREIIKEAFKNGLIIEGQTWIDMLDQRNELTHRYNEKQAKHAVFLIREVYFPAIQQVYEKLKSLKE
jgi:nucleotidyltransferase substrate binding protein (TIGR01987 family)